MASLAEQENIKLALQTDGKFYKWCLTYLEKVSPLVWHSTIVAYHAPAVRLSPRQRTYLFHYFKWRFLTDQSTPAPEYGVPQELGSQVQREIPRKLQPEETPVTNKLAFTQQHLLNGTDIATLDNAQIYGLIANEEARLKKLEEIKNKPKRLLEEITAGYSTLNELVHYLDTH